MTSTPAIPDQTDVTTELYKSVIGPVNQSYYLRVFAHFDAKGKTGILWHWPACFTTLNWLIFRKMWGMAAWFAGLSLVFTLAVFGIGKLVFSYSETTEGILTGLTLLAVFVLPGLFANAAYYRFCERTINSVLVTGVGVPAACEILAKRASSPRRLLGLAALNTVALAMFVALLVWVPGVQLDGKLPALPATVPPELASQAEPAKAPALAASAAQAAASALLPASEPAALSASEPAAASASAPALTPAVPELVEPASLPASGAAPSGQAASAAKSPSAHSIRLPVLPSPVASAPALPVAKPVAPTPSAAAVARVGPAGAAQQPAPAPPAAPMPAPPPAPAPPAAPPPAPAPSYATSAASSPIAQQYFIQVGAFANLQNARKTMSQLEAMGLDAGAAPVVVEDGRLTRIRVGPFRTRTEARKAADQIKAQGLPALFVKL